MKFGRNSVGVFVGIALIIFVGSMKISGDCIADIIDECGLHLTEVSDRASIVQELVRTEIPAGGAGRLVIRDYCNSVMGLTFCSMQIVTKNCTEVYRKKFLFHLRDGSLDEVLHRFDQKNITEIPECRQMIENFQLF